MGPGSKYDKYAANHSGQQPWKVDTGLDHPQHLTAEKVISSAVNGVQMGAMI